MECSIILFQTRSVHAFIFSGHDHGWKNKPEGTGINSIVFAFVTAAILVSQNNRTWAILVSQTNPVGVELSSYTNAFFCSNKFAFPGADHVSENTLLRFSNTSEVRFTKIIWIRISDPRSLGSVDQMNRWIIWSTMIRVIWLDHLKGTFPQIFMGFSTGLVLPSVPLPSLFALHSGPASLWFVMVTAPCAIHNFRENGLDSKNTANRSNRKSG